MYDVLFVVPIFKESIEDESVGTLILATILKQKGLNVRIYRLHEASLDDGFLPFIANTANNILAENPKIISFYCRCDCYLANIQTARLIKEKAPQIPIVFAGPQADASSYETLNRIPWVDFCCSGEGETTAYPLFNALLNGTDYTDIPGLSYRNSQNQIIENERPALIKDLNTIPQIDYSFIPDSTIEHTLAHELFPIEVGRGCPFNCAFCSTSLFWQRRFRLKSNESIIDEIEMLSKKYGATRFKFRHDLFTANKERILEFCNMLKARNLTIEWRCSSRIDTIDEESIVEMRNSGLTSMYLGIETGSERMQKITHKNLKIEDILRVSKLLKEHNISATFSFIYGFPEEEENDIEDTLQLAAKLYSMGHRGLQFHLYAMLVGTEYYNKYKDELVFSTKHSNIVGSLGTDEFTDYINENKEVFPFYYEYTNALRKKYVDLEDYALICIELFDLICNLSPDKKDKIKITELYHTIKKSSPEIPKSNSKGVDFRKNKYTLFKNCAASLFDEKDADKFVHILDFIEKRTLWLQDKNSVTDVLDSPVDIKAYLKGATLDDINFVPTIIHLNKIAGKAKIVAVNLK